MVGGCGGCGPGGVVQGGVWSGVVWSRGPGLGVWSRGVCALGGVVWGVPPNFFLIFFFDFFGDPSPEADSGIWSTSGRYASYWNAFLFLNIFPVADLREAVQADLSRNIFKSNHYQLLNLFSQQRIIDYLKFDVDGYEWGILQDLMTSLPLRRGIKQIGLKLHTKYPKSCEVAYLFKVRKPW